MMHKRSFATPWFKACIVGLAVWGLSPAVMAAPPASSTPQASFSSSSQPAKPKVKAYSHIQWASLNFTQALQQAKENKRLLFVDMYATWCFPCKKYDRMVFSRTKVATYVHQHFVPLRRNGYRGEGNYLRRRYNCVTFPCLLVIDSEGNEVERITRYHNPPQFLARLEQIRVGQDTLATLQKQLAKQPNNQLIRYRVAYRLAYRGDSRCIKMLRSVSNNPPKGFTHLAPQSLYVLGRIYYRNTKRDWPSVVKVFREYLQRFPNHRKASRVRSLLRQAIHRMNRRR
ncbi:MAG: DUF255 domain-containing protein [Deltaproteobacteria bacterium]|nr:MAG: DUF255 domain-containing protein [Deltaproteobacteria bacterium]